MIHISDLDTCGGFLCYGLLPLETINGSTYAVERRTQTVNGIARIDAYDISRFDTTDAESIRAMRFNADGSEDPGGQFVVIAYPDEGHVALITEGGLSRWCGAWAVSLSSDPQLQSDLLDELERSVDAGGQIGF